MKTVRRILEFLVYSNIYLSLGAAIVALATIFLMKKPIVWDLLFIPFSASFLVYNLNRLTDSSEDSINIPERHIFIQKYGRGIFIISILLYVIALYLAFHSNLYVLLFTIIPVMGAFIYSYFRFKRFFLIKNLIVSLSWGFSALLVGGFFKEFDILLLLIYIFFALQLLSNVIIFDIKDVRGDSVYKIRTLPEKIGIEKTKRICFFILFLLFLTWISLMSFSIKSLVFLPVLIYIAVFIKKAEKHEKSPWWYYGVFVDGEFFILLASVLAWWIVSGI